MYRAFKLHSCSIISNEAYRCSENEFTHGTYFTSFITSSGISDWPFLARDVKVSNLCCNLSYRSDLTPLIPRLLHLIFALGGHIKSLWEQHTTWLNSLAREFIKSSFLVSDGILYLSYYNHCFKSRTIYWSICSQLNKCLVDLGAGAYSTSKVYYRYLWSDSRICGPGYL